MKQYKIVLKNLEPFCVRSGRANDMISTLNYIPGTTLLGAIVNRYIMEKEKDKLFHLYFTKDKVFFSNMYPAAEVKDSTTKNTTMPLPIPNTARVCKRWELEHGIIDTLFDWALYNQLHNEDSNEITILSERELCASCVKNKQRLTPFSGFYTISENSNQVSICNVEKSLQTHTGINRHTQTVSEGILYNLEAIEKKYIFEGILIFSDDVPDENVDSFVSWISGEVIHIGAKKCSGLGSCQLQLESLPVQTFDDFKERLVTFDKKYKQYKSGYKKNETDDSFYFSIDLLSEAIFLDEYLNYNVGFTSLNQEINLLETTLIYERVNPLEVYGWNSSTCLPRQTEEAVEKGATSFFQSKMDKDQLINALFDAESKGIGIRKVEGFGRISVSNRFHFEKR